MKNEVRAGLRINIWQLLRNISPGYCKSQVESISLQSGISVCFMKLLEICHKIQCMLTVMLVMMATLVQFHHHDCQGNIYWHLTLGTDIEIGVDGCSIEECHHDADSRCNHQHEHHNGCSMHIGVAMVSDHSDYTQHQTGLNVAILVYTAVVLPCIRDNNHIRSDRWQYDRPHYDDPFLDSFCFRGPPVCNA